MFDTSMKNYILCVGTGHGLSKLTAFDRALLAAGLSEYNLLKVSSILPPMCQLQKTITQNKGMLLPSAFSSIYSNVVGETISAAVAVGIPENENDVGVIMEHSAYSSKMHTEEIVRSFVTTAMSDRGIQIKTICSISTECVIEVNNYYCAVASVSMW